MSELSINAYDGYYVEKVVNTLTKMIDIYI